ncbi:hypothetical protein LCGC14_0401620 [marine sediment metagenome]|uniref:Major tail protein n=1 Tax=marine sediment metagenome TaxID=412755 RepID=A0A0F9T2B1_9ZZZZ
MAQGFFEGGNAENYTIGGIRAWFNRLIDGAATPKEFEGFFDLGNVVEAPQESEKEEVEHFTAKTGTRKRDRLVTRDISEDIVLTLDELSIENLRHFFRAGTVTDVAASAGGKSVDDEVMSLTRTDTRFLRFGRNAATIVVKDLTDVTTFVLDTDYSVVEVLATGGDSWKGIKRIAAGAITDGQLVRVDYVSDIAVHRLIKPQVVSNVEGQLVLIGASDTGNEFIRHLNNVQIDPEGSFDFDDEDFSTFQLRVAILDDSDDIASEPFGTLEFYGTGFDLA